jgi:putative membrane protein
MLVNIAEAGADAAVKARLVLMGMRLYRFGHMMFGLALLLGLALWQGWRMFPQALPNMVGTQHWIDAKLTFVLLLLVFYIWSGRALKRSAAGGSLPSSRALRIINELPVLFLLGALFMVIAKPF